MLNEEFINKANTFREFFDLSEEDIDKLLKPKNLKYSRLESRRRTLTLELAEAYPLVVYGIKYCDFKKSDTTFPAFEQLPKATQTLLENKSKSGNKVGAKGTKNKACYVLYIIKDYPIKENFNNSQIIPFLPPPADLDSSIDWNKGLLKGLVKNINKSNTILDKDGKSKVEATYEIIKIVDQELLERALKKIDKEWLEELKEKTKQK